MSWVLFFVKIRLLHRWIHVRAKSERQRKKFHPTAALCASLKTFYLTFHSPTERDEEVLSFNSINDEAFSTIVFLKSGAVARSVYIKKLSYDGKNQIPLMIWLQYRKIHCESHVILLSSFNMHEIVNLTAHRKQFSHTQESFSLESFFRCLPCVNLKPKKFL